MQSLISALIHIFCGLKGGRGMPSLISAQIHIFL